MLEYIYTPQNQVGRQVNLFSCFAPGIALRRVNIFLLRHIKISSSSSLLLSLTGSSASVDAFVSIVIKFLSDSTENFGDKIAIKVGDEVRLTAGSTNIMDVQCNVYCLPTHVAT